MAIAQHEGTDLTDQFEELYRTHYQDEIYALAEGYPGDQRSLVIDYDDLFQFDLNLADDLLEQPEVVLEYAEEALRLYDIPIDVTLEQAHVRVRNVPETQSFHPGGFSPDDHAGHFRAIEGEISKSSDVFAKMLEAAFECQRCGTYTRVPQDKSTFQEPHECEACERQGPFEVDTDRSELIDAQLLRIQTPPEIAEGSGQTIDVHVEDDLAGVATIGDRVTVSGVIHLEQQSSGNQMTGKFDPYLEGHHITMDETDQQDLDVSTEERQRIEALAAGEEGDPLELAVDSFAPRIFGYRTMKKALILTLASSGVISGPTDGSDRATLNFLGLGDPGTGKSKLVNRAEKLGWRTVGVSSKRATAAGLTVAAEQDDFGDGDWSLKAGAFVKANGGTVCIDELDDMDPDVRAAMLEPMSTQRINASVAGEQATFSTVASVIAVGNPKYGRFDLYEPINQQFDFDGALLSRFDLIFTVKDEPDEEEDRKLGGHILDTRDAAKRFDQGEELTDEEAEKVEPAVEPELFRKWIALAKQQPIPSFESTELRDQLLDNWVQLRGLYDFDDDSPIPVTARNLEGIVRVAEAAAMFELSETIQERHAKIATQIVGRSMDDIGRNEDGEMDADIIETGTSKSQRDRKQTLEEIATELMTEYEGGKFPQDEFVDRVVEETGIEEHRVEDDIETMRFKEGTMIEPEDGWLRYIGRR